MSHLVYCFVLYAQLMTWQAENESETESAYTVIQNRVFIDRQSQQNIISQVERGEKNGML